MTNPIVESDQYLHILSNIGLVLDNIRPSFLLQKYDDKLVEAIKQIDSRILSFELKHYSKGIIGTLFFINYHHLIGSVHYTDEEIGELLGYPETLNPSTLYNKKHYMYTFDIYEGNTFRDQIYAFNTTKLLYEKKYQDLCKNIENSVKNNLPEHYSLRAKILVRNESKFYIDKINAQENLTSDELYDLSLFFANYESPHLFEMLQSNKFIFGDIEVDNLDVVNKLLTTEPYKIIILMTLFNHQPNKHELVKNYWYETLRKDSTTPM